MKIALIGSTQYKSKFMSLQDKLEEEGHNVFTPAFDDHDNWDELQICEYNRSIIDSSDKVIMIWDRRSVGTVFDFGMVFALRKPFEIFYLEPKTIENVMIKYSKFMENI